MPGAVAVKQFKSSMSSHTAMQALHLLKQHGKLITVKVLYISTFMRDKGYWLKEKRFLCEAKLRTLLAKPNILEPIKAMYHQSRSTSAKRL